MMHVAYPQQAHQMPNPAPRYREQDARRPTVNASSLPPLPHVNQLHPGELKDPAPEKLAAVGLLDAPRQYVLHDQIYAKIPGARTWSKQVSFPTTFPANAPCPKAVTVALPPAIQDPALDLDFFPSLIIALPPRAGPSTSPLSAFFDTLDGAAQPAVTRLLPARMHVLAAFCANMPALTLPHRPRAASWTLPVLPLPVPRPDGYHIVHEYLHEQDPRALFAAFLPSLLEEADRYAAASSASSSSPGSSSSALSPRRSPYSAFAPAQLHALAALLDAHAHAQAQRLGRDPLALVYNHARRIIDAQKNARFLGVCSEEFWCVLRACYAVVYAAADRVRAREL